MFPSSHTMHAYALTAMMLLYDATARSGCKSTNASMKCSKASLHLQNGYRRSCSLQIKQKQNHLLFSISSCRQKEQQHFKNTLLAPYKHEQPWVHEKASGPQPCDSPNPSCTTLAALISWPQAWSRLSLLAGHQRSLHWHSRCGGDTSPALLCILHGRTRG